MILNFKLKTQITKGIDVESPGAQASEIAAMLGAQGFVVDGVTGKATFTVGTTTITVGAGQVISITDGAVSVKDRADFYSVFEAAGEP